MRHEFQCRRCAHRVIITSDKGMHPFFNRLAPLHGQLLMDGDMLNHVNTTDVENVPDITIHSPSFASDGRFGTVLFVNIPALARQWVTAIRTGAALPANVTNNGPHNTDPQTMMHKAAGVGVTEYYIGGPAGSRGVVRRQHTRTDIFYSHGHLGNTYQYRRVIGGPPTPAEILRATTRDCIGTLQYVGLRD